MHVLFSNSKIEKIGNCAMDFNSLTEAKIAVQWLAARYFCHKFACGCETGATRKAIRADWTGMPPSKHLTIRDLSLQN